MYPQILPNSDEKDVIFILFWELGRIGKISCLSKCPFAVQVRPSGMTSTVLIKRDYVPASAARGQHHRDTVLPAWLHSSWQPVFSTRCAGPLGMQWHLPWVRWASQTNWSRSYNINRVSRSRPDATWHSCPRVARSVTQSHIRLQQRGASTLPNPFMCGYAHLAKEINRHEQYMPNSCVEPWSQQIDVLNEQLGSLAWGFVGDCTWVQLVSHQPNK